MYTASDFNGAYRDYVQFNKDLIESRGAFGGILKVFGFDKTGNDPGHEKFLSEMKSAIQSVCSEQPAPYIADQIADVIFSARKTYADEGVSIYLFIAVESYAVDLIPFLSKEKARELFRMYKEENPRRLWVPAQKTTFQALKKAAQ
ncbi:MAG: hypothetical protein IJ106_04715 [Parasporobacterium sp.]|nr:hypothetical protein [Parasporobacterium sp.]